MSKLNILVYSGSGVSSASLAYTVAALRAWASHRYDIQTVTPKTLRSEPWTDNCALLVFPGGRDLPYHFDLQGEANQRIKAWVLGDGGKYLGFCAGAYYASASVRFEPNTSLEVIGERELGFFPGECRGAVYPGFEYETENGAREVPIRLERAAWKHDWVQPPDELPIWYNGGGAFWLKESMSEDDTKVSVSVLGRYADRDGQPIAGVLCETGLSGGRAVLWAVHPEHPPVAEGSAKASSSLQVGEKETLRRGLMRSTLKLLGIDVVQVDVPPPALLPLFLASENTALVCAIATEIKSRHIGADRLQDRHDSFSFYDTELSQAIVQESRTRSGTIDADELRALTKDVIVCSNGVPTTAMTPLFDLHKYFRIRKALSESSAGLGHLILYGEVVTSTQTLLDKNDRLLSCLPAGLVCLASHQLIGRGRGGNSWVSPAGCLQFSLVLRLNSHQADKIVFIQYLFGLAVVEAIRTLPGYEQIDLVLKWPNDIYGRVTNAEGKVEFLKIGGILVNSSYCGDEFSLVVGCGINTSNPKPTASVNDLVGAFNDKTGARLALLDQETLLAMILTRFELMWPKFKEAGFSPFMEGYLSRWIHS